MFNATCLIKTDIDTVNKCMGQNPYNPETFLQNFASRLTSFDDPLQEAVQKFYPFMIEYICDKEDSDNDTQQYILKNLNSLGNSVDFWGRKNDRQHVIDGMSTTQKSQLLCYILRNHEVFGKMTCRDWKNWLLDDAEPQFGIWF